MDREGITQKIEDLATALVMAGPEDVQELAQIHTLFEEVAVWATDADLIQVASVSGGAAGMVAQLIMGDAPNPGAVMTALVKSVEALQQVFRDNRDSSEVDFPLGVDSDEPVADTKAKAEPEAEESEEPAEEEPVEEPATAEEPTGEDATSNDDSGFDERQQKFLDRQLPLMQGLLGILRELADDEDSDKIREIFNELGEEAGSLGLTEVMNVCAGADEAIAAGGITKQKKVLVEACDWLCSKLGALSKSSSPPQSPDFLLDQLDESSKAIPLGTDTGSMEEVELHEEGTAFLQDVDMIHDFMDEAMEHLEAADGHLLALESQPNDEEALNAIFRAFHTIKGVAGFLELRNIQMLAHEAENMLDLMRKPHINVTSSSIDLSFESTDHLKQMMELLAEALQTHEPPTPPATLASLIPRLRCELDVLEGKVPAASAPPMPPPTSNGKISDIESVRMFIPDVNDRLEEIDAALMTLEKAPEDAEAINAIFRAFHTIKGESAFLELMDIQRLAHETESLLENFRDDPTAKFPQEAIDLVFEANDLLKRMISELTDNLESQTVPPPPEGIESLISRVQAQVQELNGTVVQSPPTAVASPEPTASQRPQTRKPPTMQKTGAAEPQKAKEASRGAPKTVREALKVDAQRLDLLIDTIGELVIAEAMVSQSEELRSNKSPELRTHLNHLNKITRELQQIGMGLRMVTVRGTFNRMARVVRDLTKKIGKEVDFITEGEDTELDKTVVDSIGDPLLHMIRNAVDHGLEDPQARVAAGKPAKGRVELRAYHKGGNIYIEVKDDGRGLNHEAILNKAVERGIIREEDIASMSDRQINNLVFAPGFSTAASVTNVSGRGVGMDVVKRNIENLRGAVDITSVVGKGSTFTIRLPLTLAIIDGMLTGVGQERYVIPTLSIVRTVQPGEGDIRTILNKGEMLQSDDRLIPLYRLGSLFEINGAVQKPQEALIVVVESDGQQAGILADELLGQQQIVIKSLGESLQGLLGISGGAILADGRVGLIIDVGSLVKLAHGGASHVPADEAESELERELQEIGE